MRKIERPSGALGVSDHGREVAAGQPLIFRWCER
jgi:hypothetical protein